MKIINARDKKLIDTATGLPDVSDGVAMFLQKIKVETIKKRQVDGYTQEEECCHHTMAVRQPMSPEELAIKPEGERSWNWHNLHCLTDLELQTDDIVIIHHIRHRVMKKTDYDEYGYFSYEIIEDYKK